MMKDTLACLSPVDHGLHGRNTAVLGAGLSVIEDHAAHVIENLQRTRPVFVVTGPVARSLGLIEGPFRGLIEVRQPFWLAHTDVQNLEVRTMFGGNVRRNGPMRRRRCSIRQAEQVCFESSGFTSSYVKYSK